jgi:hypothetical protein
MATLVAAVAAAVAVPVEPAVTASTHEPTVTWASVALTVFVIAVSAV